MALTESTAKRMSENSRQITTRKSIVALDSILPVQFNFWRWLWKSQPSPPFLTIGLLEETRAFSGMLLRLIHGHEHLAIFLHGYIIHLAKKQAFES